MNLQQQTTNEEKQFEIVCVEILIAAMFCKVMLLMMQSKRVVLLRKFAI